LSIPRRNANHAQANPYVKACVAERRRNMRVGVKLV
jgi:hypothetical protein